MRTFLLIALSFVVIIPAAGQTCETETDEFTGDTTITCDNEEVTVEDQPGEPISLAAVATIFSEESENTVISVVTRSDSWNFLSIDESHALIDGERYTFKTTRAGGDTQRGSIKEQIVLVITPTEYRAIANASSFRLKAETAVFDLTPAIAQFQRIDEIRSR